ncbi:MAG: prenyltransferase/squalene oxidase repeat-containing protein [Candidatus Thorarchaeota archaeon]|jgi:prenyltransferase beta subunit
MKRKYFVLTILGIIIVTSFLPLVSSPSKSNLSTDDRLESLQDSSNWESIHQLAADAGVSIEMSPYIILELQNASIPSKGVEWSNILTGYGIVSRVVSIAELLSAPSILEGAPAVLVDASVGSENASMVPDSIIQLLTQTDVSLILTGHAAWLLHRLRETGPPSATAPSSSVLIPAPGNEGAVYLSSPIMLTINSSITSETGIVLPSDFVQGEHSRIVDLTGSSSSSDLSSLRYYSWPLDIFLFVPQDPSLLTLTGRGLVVNTIAYSSVMKESAISTTLYEKQVPPGTLLEGGFSYLHEPTLDSAYYAVRTMNSLLTDSEWSLWSDTIDSLISYLLGNFIFDYGVESGFCNKLGESMANLKSTAQGLWLVESLNLTSTFELAKLVEYLKNRQDADGSFENDITKSYLVIEALTLANELSVIDSILLESWLRSCVIDGSKTSDPTLWGSIGVNPNGLSPRNTYAAEYVATLDMLGANHHDPAKLTSWILAQTMIGDGSFSNYIGITGEIVRGTSSALRALLHMGTLSSENKTSGLSWLLVNQQVSGGFGVNDKDSDIVGKMKETNFVALCLEDLSEDQGLIASNIKDFIQYCQTDVGFEAMEPIPSLMWSYWLGHLSRMSHAGGIVNYNLARDYLASFFAWAQYPSWDNMTLSSAPEYGIDQYFTKSVWTQYFGVAMASDFGYTLPLDVIGNTISYLSQAQYMTGHYRPTSLMGTAHLQYTAAAVEALFLIDSIDTIPYRSNLDAAVLSDYTAGTWSATGWTIKPFAGQQSAIDYFGTRTALRLNLISPTMATEISSAIASRVQYGDLWSLSMDVATLALLNSSGFFVELESIDNSQVLTALGSNPFPSGWFNQSLLWQPLFSSSVLDMISILGLKPSLWSSTGNAIIASAASLPQVGGNLTIDVNISSGTTRHSVLVYAFNEWIQFNNVQNSDSLSLTVPNESSFLGSQTVSIMVWDYSFSRGFDSVGVDIHSQLQGSLSIDTPSVLVDESINGTVSWKLITGADAGDSQITIRLSDGVFYQQWTDISSSIYQLSIPTTGFNSGIHNLTVQVEKPYCEPIVFWKEVVIISPDPTYLRSSSLISGYSGHELSIDWSLHFLSNNTEILLKSVLLTVRDNSQQIIHVASNDSGLFHWTPTDRGNYSYVIVFSGDGSLTYSESRGLIYVYELPVISIMIPSTISAPSTVTITILIEDNNQIGLDSISTDTNVILNGISILDTSNITDANGLYTLTLRISRPGTLSIIVIVPVQGWIQSWSETLEITVQGITTIILTTPQQAMAQGSAVGIVAAFNDWNGFPLSNVEIWFYIKWINGTLLHSELRTTGPGGMSAIAFTFTLVGEFLINATFAGDEINLRATEAVSQTIQVTPTFILHHTPTCLVGDSLELEVGLTDYYNEYISGRMLLLSIEQNGMIVFEMQVVSEGALVTIQWNTIERGMGIITLLHPGDAYVLSNSTQSNVSVMEVISGEISLSSSTVDLFSEISIEYRITSSNKPLGIVIHFEVLGVDLVPLWSAEATTNNSGYANVNYLASESHGILAVRAGPLEDQFLLGGDVQGQLIVKTSCHPDVNLLPTPTTATNLANITIELLDDLGQPINGLSVTVSAFDSLGQQIRLGTFTSSVSVVTFNGFAIVTFTPIETGLYQIGISSIGSISIHGFTNTSMHTVHSTTNIQLSLSDLELAVAETLAVSVILTDHNDNPLVNKFLSLILDGPGILEIGPFQMSTNNSGEVTWYIPINDEGLWGVYVSFDGIGVYLPTSTSGHVDVKFSTEIIMSIVDTGEVIAGESPITLSVLLRDSSETPLEGFTIHYQVFHDLHGLSDEGYIVQTGQIPFLLNITLARMGNHTFIMTFDGTAHYHSSMSADRAMVIGTTSISIEGPTELDRSENASFYIQILDEIESACVLEELLVTLSLQGATNVVSIEDRLIMMEDHLYLSLQGLPVDNYSFNVTVRDSGLRLGSSIDVAFVVTSWTAFEIASEKLPGLIGSEHSITVHLKDSFNEIIDSATIWVSLYAPDGREIYGSILSIRTNVQIENGIAEISWTPNAHGVYNLSLLFDGEPLMDDCHLQISSLARYPTSITLEMTREAFHGDSIPVTLTLSGLLSKIQGATVILSVSLNGTIITEEDLITGFRGSVQTELRDLPAGNHTIVVSYLGSESFVPCAEKGIVIVLPQSSLTMEVLNSYVNFNCTLRIAVTLFGVSPNWQGMTEIIVNGPTGNQVGQWVKKIGEDTIIEVSLFPSDVGLYSANITLLGLPVISRINHGLSFSVTDAPIQLPLDAGTTPVVGGIGLVVVLGYVVRRKLRGIFDDLPGEWTE